MPAGPWGFNTVPIPIPYPYSWESPRESPHPRQPCLQIKVETENFGLETSVVSVLQRQEYEADEKNRRVYNAKRRSCSEQVIAPGGGETICLPRRWQFDSRRIYDVRPRTGPQSANG